MTLSQSLVLFLGASACFAADNDPAFSIQSPTDRQSSIVKWEEEPLPTIPERDLVAPTREKQQRQNLALHFEVLWNVTVHGNARNLPLSSREVVLEMDCSSNLVRLGSRHGPVIRWLSVGQWTIWNTYPKQVFCSFPLPDCTLEFRTLSTRQQHGVLVVRSDDGGVYVTTWTAKTPPPVISRHSRRTCPIPGVF